MRKSSSTRKTLRIAKTRIAKQCSALLLLACPWVAAHDVITTKITFDREVIRIIYPRCASCHKPGGSAFSLITYSEARPWAKAIQEEVLERRMPPWGAVKGFGDFRNDQALTPEQIEVIADWVEGGAPEGEEKDLPPPPKPVPAVDLSYAPHPLVANGDLKISHALKLEAITPEKVPAGESFQVTAQLPGGAIEPLLWLQPFKSAYAHPFVLRTPLDLPAGTEIRGVPPGASLILQAAP